MDRPPFDPAKAAFALVAGVLAVECVIALATVGACLWWSREIVEGRYSCGPAGERVSEMMVGALAAALALTTFKGRQ